MLLNRPINVSTRNQPRKQPINQQNNRPMVIPIKQPSKQFINQTSRPHNRKQPVNHPVNYCNNSTDRPINQPTARKGMYDCAIIQFGWVAKKNRTRAHWLNRGIPKALRRPSEVALFANQSAELPNPENTHIQ